MSDGLSVGESYGLQHRVSLRRGTKYQYKVLTGDVAIGVRERVRQIGELFEIRIIKGVVSQEHLPILVSAPPTRTPSESMRRIKGKTSSPLFEKSPALKRYWGRHLWARGYFCATAGQVIEEMIKAYLGHHFEPTPDDDFKTES